VNTRVPDIGDIAGEERPSLAPVRTIVVGYPARAGGGRYTSIVAPGRVVVDAVGRIGDHQMRANIANEARDIRSTSRVAAKEAMTPEDPEIAGP